MRDPRTLILLYGPLGTKFGRRRRRLVSSPREAISALCATVDGFEEYLIAHQEQGYQILVDEAEIGEEDLDKPFSGKVIKIIPVVDGANGSGVKMIVGLAILAAAGAFTGGAAFPLIGGGGWLASVGLTVGTSMVLAGVAQSLAPSPTSLTPSGNTTNTAGSFFDGPVNTTTQGNCVPVGYGELEVGSAVISFGSNPDEVFPTGTNGGPFGGSDGNGTMTGDGETTPWVWGKDSE